MSVKHTSQYPFQTVSIQQAVDFLVICHSNACVASVQYLMAHCCMTQWNMTYDKKSFKLVDIKISYHNVYRDTIGNV